MKKLLVAFTSVLILGSCMKKDNKCGYTDSTIVAPAAEVQALKDSLTAHGIEATQDPSGFFYTINKPGTAPSVTNLCTIVSVTYKGSFLNGKVFDSTATGDLASFQLGRVITGWQKGVPLISTGGDITLYVPPSLAYGSSDYPSTGTVAIPGGSNLVFNIGIVGLQQ